MLDIDDAQQLLVDEIGWVGVIELHRVPGQDAVVFKTLTGHENYLKNSAIKGWRRVRPPMHQVHRFDLEVG